MKTCFRPLSWGPFFNKMDGIAPFIYGGRFSSPFSGTFFQCVVVDTHFPTKAGKFSSPFLGTFFQWIICFSTRFISCFRPLSWELFSMV